MGVNYFTDEQVKYLNSNPNVKKASNKAITYHDHFKEHVVNEYNKGRLPRDIFEEAGLCSSILGMTRIEQSAHRFRRQAERFEGYIFYNYYIYENGEVNFDKVFTTEVDDLYSSTFLFAKYEKVLPAMSYFEIFKTTNKYSLSNEFNTIYIEKNNRIDIYINNVFTFTIDLKNDNYYSIYKDLIILVENHESIFNFEAFLDFIEEDFFDYNPHNAYSINIYYPYLYGFNIRLTDGTLYINNQYLTQTSSRYYFSDEDFEFVDLSNYHFPD